MLTTPLSKLHTVTFNHDYWNGRKMPDTVGRCTCGWIMRGARAAVYGQAALHDLDQWPLTDDDMHSSL